MTVASSDVAPLTPTRLPLGRLESATVRRLVVGIWILWACLLLGGTLLCESVRGGTIASWRNQILLVSHLGSSALLVAAGWIWFLGFSRSAAAGTCGLFAAGMTLGAIGDCFNGGVLQGLMPLPDPVLGGIAAFALGHIAYITACVRVARQCGFHSAENGWQRSSFGRSSGSSRGTLWSIPGRTAERACSSGRRCLTRCSWQGRLASRPIWRWRTADSSCSRRGPSCFSISDLVLAFRMFHGDFAGATHAGLADLRSGADADRVFNGRRWCYEHSGDAMKAWFFRRIAA